ncbi:hypothetical protein ACFYVR_13240 [Rhodococcus sp. NPDC003318]|uniref:hypothetical protein n=1 Tax=Rhodococcus sp. NPDC003318 TaxID=3364503 RepID=UPI0036B73A89
MDLFDVARACIRRWYIFLPLMLVTAWFGYTAYTNVKPVYYASTTIGLAPPSVRTQPPNGEDARRNALVDTGGAPLLANLLAMGLMEPTVSAQVTAAGGDAGYTAKVFSLPPPLGQLPLVTIESQLADPAQVTKTLEVVAAQGQSTLQALQQSAGVPADEMVSTFVVQPPGPPVQAMPSRTRSALSILIAGAGLSTLVTVLLDVALSRRRAKPVNPERDSESPRSETDGSPSMSPERDSSSPAVETEGVRE